MKKYNAPRVKESRRVQLLTTIWLVPFVALIIALWLGYQYYAKIGSSIKISFKSNAGLVENQSPIKMRDVTIGIVKKISLSDNGKGVIIEARMNREVDNYLNEKAKFWIVHPDVGSHGISGLDTIVSGSYIELYGKKEGKRIYNYIGLEEAYITDDAKGAYFVLSAPQSYNITEGSNIYYRMIKIGRVKRVGISPDGTHINFTTFIEEQFVEFINNKSSFYTSSAFNIDFSQENLDVTIASLSQLLHGGITIYTPTDSLKNDNPIKAGTIFPLYKNLAHMQITNKKGNTQKLSIMDKVNALLTKLQNLPLEKLLISVTDLLDENRKPINSLVKDLDKTIINFNKTVNNLNSFTSSREFKKLPKNLNSSLLELEATLQNLQKLSSDYSGDSKLADQLSATLKSVSEASNSFDKINKMLDRNANALVVGDE